MALGNVARAYPFARQWVTVAKGEKEKLEGHVGKSKPPSRRSSSAGLSSSRGGTVVANIGRSST